MVICAIAKRQCLGLVFYMLKHFYNTSLILLMASVTPGSFLEAQCHIHQPAHQDPKGFRSPFYLTLSDLVQSDYPT